MATWVYKDGEGTLVDALNVGYHLDAGYTLEKNPPKKVEVQKPESKKVKRPLN